MVKIGTSADWVKEEPNGCSNKVLLCRANVALEAHISHQIRGLSIIERPY